MGKLYDLEPWFSGFRFSIGVLVGSMKREAGGVQVDEGLVYVLVVNGLLRNFVEQFGDPCFVEGIQGGAQTIVIEIVSLDALVKKNFNRQVSKERRGVVQSLAGVAHTIQDHGGYRISY